MTAGRSRGCSGVRDHRGHDGHHPPREGLNLDTRLTLRPPEAAQALGVSERLSADIAEVPLLEGKSDAMKRALLTTMGAMPGSRLIQ